jgi:hypothetical protein
MLVAGGAHHTERFESAADLGSLLPVLRGEAVAESSVREAELEAIDGLDVLEASRGEIRQRLISDNYFCRSTTTTSAGSSGC